MKNRKGFISTSIIYSFFLVFILLMIASIMSYANKRFLIDKISENTNFPPDIPTDYLKCKEGDLLSHCLFKNEWQQMDKLWNKIYSWCDENGIPRETPKGQPSLCGREEAFAAGVITEEELYYMKIQAAIYPAAKYAIDTEKLNKIKKHFPDLPNGTEKSAGETKEAGIYRSNDLYFYRGAEKDNFVVFANKLWSVVNINEDSNTIKLIYQGEYTDDFKNKTTSDKYTYIKNNGFIDVNRSGGIDEQDARHFNVNQTDKTWKKERYTTAYKYYLKKGEYWCDKSEYKNELLKYIEDFNCKSSIENQRKILEKMLEYGNTNGGYSGAYYICNVGYMNNGDWANLNVKNLNNDEDSTIKFIIDAWSGDNENFNENYKQKMANNVQFCSGKDFAINGNNYVGGALCNKNNQGAMIFKNASVFSSSGASWSYGINTYVDVYSTSTKNDVNNECKNLGYESGDYFKASTITAIGVTNYAFTSKYCNEESKMPKGLFAGLITATEILEAGGAYGMLNDSFYLDSERPYWTADFAMGTGVDKLPYKSNYFIYNGEYVTTLNDVPSENGAYIKPVINLKGSVKYIEGNGTIDNPYIIGG